MFESFITSNLFLLVFSLLILIDTILGITIGIQKEGFNLKKLLYGILKGLIIGLCIVVFCFLIEIIYIILKRINIELSNDIIYFVEFIIITITVYKKYVLEIIKKLKKIFND